MNKAKCCGNCSKPCALEKKKQVSYPKPVKWLTIDRVYVGFKILLASTAMSEVFLLLGRDGPTQLSAWATVGILFGVSAYRLFQRCVEPQLLFDPVSGRRIPDMVVEIGEVVNNAMVSLIIGHLALASLKGPIYYVDMAIVCIAVAIFTVVYRYAVYFSNTNTTTKENK
jgi:hypothetical protein